MFFGVCFDYEGIDGLGNDIFVFLRDVVIVGKCCVNEMFMFYFCVEDFGIIFNYNMVEM